MDTVEASEQGGRVLHAVAVVGGDHLEQEQHLLMRYCLDHKAIIPRQEEHAAALARARQFPQRPVHQKSLLSHCSGTSARRTSSWGLCS